MIRKLINLICYCGVSKEEYNSVKIDAYKSNFKAWKYLHMLMGVIYIIYFLYMFTVNSFDLYSGLCLATLIYFIVVTILFFFVLKDDSLIAQFIIYFSMIVLLLTGYLIAISYPDQISVTYIVALLLISIFMIDKPFYMIIVVVIADIIFILGINSFESPDIIAGDTADAITYGIISIIVNIFYNYIRVREFLFKHQSEKYAFEKIKNERMEAQLEINRKAALISSLSEDFECVYYIEVTDDSTFDEVKEFRPNVHLGEVIPGWKDERNFLNLLNMMRDYYVAPSDKETFAKAVERDTVLKALENNKVLFINFIALENGNEKYCQIKFTADRNENGKIVGIVMGLHSVDEEIKEELKIRAELSKANEKAERTIIRRTNELLERTDELQRVNDEIIELMATVLEIRNDESGLHIKRIKNFTNCLAVQMKKDWPEYGLTEEDIKIFTSASALHDVGKIRLPDAILSKAGQYTAEEFNIMKTHCILGSDMLKKIPTSVGEKYMNTALDICRYHHERWDGGGYPEQLKGDAIPLSAQIVSVADCFDSLTSDTLRKKAYDKETAFNMILNGECGAFSDKIISSFKNVKEIYFEICDNADYRIEENSLVGYVGNRLSGIDILLIDDSELSLDLNRDILETDGADVTVAKSGKEALEILKNNKNMDAVVTDLIMDEMDGFETAKEIRKLEEGTGKFVPIIALTGDTLRDYKEELKEAGIDALMTKPLIIGDFARVLLNSIIEHTENMQKKLKATQIKAHVDPLTKLNNVTAYTEKVAELTKEIQCNENVQFAIVMCDINNLKTVNDTYGHDLGDVYIKNCCKIISNTFKFSPVYRIGGDEFVVVLTGQELENRNFKMKELFDAIDKAEKVKEYADGKASLAAGMAIYDKKTDSNVSEVVKRADVLMYNNKRSRKKSDQRQETSA